jgi:hypothetical protein
MIKELVYNPSRLPIVAPIEYMILSVIVPKTIFFILYDQIIDIENAANNTPTYISFARKQVFIATK